MSDLDIIVARSDRALAERHSRGTGRTTGMLRAAFDAASAGHTVLVVMAHRAAIDTAKHILDSYIGNVSETMKRIRIFDIDTAESGRLRGCQFDAVFVDHDARRASA